jgi:signal transduction histidine kinase
MSASLLTPTAANKAMRKRGSRSIALAPLAALGLLLANLALFAIHSRHSTRLAELATRSDSNAATLTAERTTNARLGALVWTFALASALGFVALIVLRRRDGASATANSTEAQLSREQADEEVHARAAELTQLSRHLIRVAEEEKAQLARELHDTFGSNLTAINMDLNWIAKRLPPERSELRERLQRALGMLSETVRSTQEVIDRLRPSQLDNLGLAVALRSHCRELAQRLDCSCEFEALEDFESLDQMHSIALYRVAQEALENAEKHAHASSIQVDLRREQNGIRLRIWDDGVGLPEESNTVSHGMAAMRERIEALGGTLIVTGARERGTQVDAFIPAEVT